MTVEIVKKDGFYGLRRKFLGISFYYLPSLEYWIRDETIEYSLERIEKAVETLKRKQAYKKTPIEVIRKIKI